MCEMKNRSILNTIKKMLGPGEDYDYFDQDLIIHINSCFSVLHQLGAGPDEGFSISGDEETWGDFVDDLSKINFVITYIYLKTKVVFDPPLNSSVLEAMKQQISEYEWRTNVEVD